jgi:tetratricopeptide (TPR) repeat protein
MKTSLNLSYLLVLAVAVLSVAWTRRLYRNLPAPHFPRQPAEFRPLSESQRADSASRAVLEKDPENIPAIIDLAIAYFEQGPDKYLEALDLLEKARDLGALDERIFYYLGSMYEVKGLPAYAIPEYERFLRRHPEDTETRLRLGNLYYRTGDLDKAVQAYKRVLELRPEDPLVVFNLALAYRDREMWEEGLNLLKSVLQKGQSLPAGGYKLLGDLYRGLGDYPQALENYHLEFSQNKEDPDLAEAMALAYEKTEDFVQAVAQWERVLELDPKNREAKKKIRLLKKRVHSG